MFDGVDDDEEDDVINFVEKQNNLKLIKKQMLYPEYFIWVNKDTWTKKLKNFIPKDKVYFFTVVLTS